jgi:hypothetical protein
MTFEEGGFSFFLKALTEIENLSLAFGTHWKSGHLVYSKLEVLTALKLQLVVFWVVTP